MSQAAFCATELLLPAASIDLQRWCALACDQFTSQPDYWEKAEALAQGVPSTLHITLPEVYLEQPQVALRIAKIHTEMQRCKAEVLTRVFHGFVYVERETQSGVRAGLVGAVDLEQYSYQHGAAPLVRPSENTVVDRIPPRLAVRRGAVLETPHIMMLLDDTAQSIIEPLSAEKATLPLLYDTPLMLGGGHVRGWAITDPARIAALEAGISALGAQATFDAAYPTAAGKAPLALAVGDGNHSLATAKAYWDEIKATLSAQEQKTHPARFALAELVNIHSPAILIEPIHRGIFGTDFATFSQSFCSFLAQNEQGSSQNLTQHFALVGAGGETMALCGQNPPHSLAVGTLELFLQKFCAENPAVRVDYIHGKQAVKDICAQQEAVGVLLPEFRKSDLFPGVVLGGVLPKKTFSMGEATEKRYYLECRAITL